MKPVTRVIGSPQWWQVVSTTFAPGSICSIAPYLDATLFTERLNSVNTTARDLDARPRTCPQFRRKPLLRRRM